MKTSIKIIASLVFSSSLVLSGCSNSFSKEATLENRAAINNFENIYLTYSTRIDNLTPYLILNSKYEIYSNPYGIEGLYFISNEKKRVLSEVTTEGLMKMKKNANGRNKKLLEYWSEKLMDKYIENIGIIDNVYGINNHV